MIQTIRIERPGDLDPRGTRIFVGDNEIHNVRSVDLRIAVDEVPTTTIETVGFPSIDGEYNLEFNFTPRTVEEALRVLRTKKCRDCDHFVGGGDFGTCCDVKYDLCYEDTDVCIKFKPRTPEEETN